MRDNNIIAKYLKKTVKFANIFQTVPFVEALLLNGSLAQGKSKESSDIDILTITTSGRLYTARFFMIVLGVLTGQKRSKEENRVHAGKFCFNYFLSDSYLKIPTGRGREMDQYCANNYKNSVLIWGSDETYERFFKVNASLFNKYLDKEIVAPCDSLDGPAYRQAGRNDIGEKMAKSFPVRDNNFAKAVRTIIERLLSDRFGDWLETRLKKLQISLIQKDERTRKYPNLVVYNDLEARFHPPKNKKKIKLK